MFGFVAKVVPIVVHINNKNGTRASSNRDQSEHAMTGMCMQLLLLMMSIGKRKGLLLSLVGLLHYSLHVIAYFLHCTAYD